MPVPYVNRYYMMKLNVKVGNIFDHLDKGEIDWLIAEASDMKTDIGVVVASIIKDAYYDEESDEGDESQKESDLTCQQYLKHSKGSWVWFMPPRKVT